MSDEFVTPPVPAMPPVNGEADAVDPSSADTFVSDARLDSVPELDIQGSADLAAIQENVIPVEGTNE